MSYGFSIPKQPTIGFVKSMKSHHRIEAKGNKRSNRNRKACNQPIKDSDFQPQSLKIKRKLQKLRTDNKPWRSFGLKSALENGQIRADATPLAEADSRRLRNIKGLGFSPECT